MSSKNVNNIRQNFKTILSYWGSKYKKDASIMENPFQTVYIPVQLIVNQSKNKHFHDIQRRAKFLYLDVRIAGIIKDGDWDLDTIRFVETPTFIACRERYLEGKEWEDTLYYKKHEEKFNKRKKGRMESTSWAEFKKRDLKRWDKLYQSMKNEGYKSQREISNDPLNEIEVAVSRHGDLILVDGGHRLAIAMLLDIKKIPVIVNVWHKQYIEALSAGDTAKLTPECAIKPALDKRIGCLD